MPTTVATTTANSSLKSLSLKFDKSTIAYANGGVATGSISCNPDNADGCSNAILYSGDALGQNHKINISGKKVTCSDFGQGSYATIYAKSADGKILSSGVKIYCEEKADFGTIICKQTVKRVSCSYTSNVPFKFEWMSSNAYGNNAYMKDSKTLIVDGTNGQKGTYYLRVYTAGSQFNVVRFINEIS